VFFSSLFYKCCETIAHSLWLEDIERILFREPTWEESISWEAGETFWKNTFSRRWEFVLNNLPCSQLIVMFGHFSKYELGIESESEEYTRLKVLTTNFLYGLYSGENITTDGRSK